MPFGKDDRRLSEMGLKIPSKGYDGESSEMAFKMPSKVDAYFIRSLFVGIIIPLVVRYSTGESSLDWRGESELVSGRDPGFTTTY